MFLYNKKVYKEVDGVAMDSPIATLLCKLVYNKQRKHPIIKQC